jgi:hypothetical protein
MTVRIASLAALSLALAGGAAHAVPTTQFQCIGYRPLSAEITPKEAQVHFEGKDWSLKRVHDNGEARYIDHRSGVVIVTKGRELVLFRGGERLACKLVSDALGPKTPPPAPSVPLSSSAPVAAR